MVRRRTPNRANSYNSSGQPGAKNGGNTRTSTIKAYVERQVAATGLVPTVAETARILAMSPDRVQQHYRILGLG